MEGASIQYSWNWGSLHGWVDWTGRATEEIRESILGGFDATIRTGVLYFTTIATRYHLSKTEAVHDRNRIRDDGSVLLVAGIDLSEKTQLDLLDFSTGYAGTYERTMPDSYHWFSGWLSELDLKYRIFGFKGSYYLGASSPLRYGDPLYSSGNYGRLDFFVDPFRNPRISSKFGLNLHLLPGDGIYHSMQILIHIQL